MSKKITRCSIYSSVYIRLRVGKLIIFVLHIILVYSVANIVEIGQHM